MIRAVLWDLDGTIADTEAFHFQAWRAILGDRGIEYVYELFMAGFGRSNPEILAELLPEVSPAEHKRIADQKEAAFRQAIRNNLTAFPGVIGWLQRLAEEHLSQLIGSSAPMANIIAMVDELQIGDYFYCLLSGVHLPKGKPDPSLFLQAAAAARTAPPECLVIEDSIHGVEAAQRAGMFSVVVGELARQPARLAALPNFAPDRCLAVPSLNLLDWETLHAFVRGAKQ